MSRFESVVSATYHLNGKRIENIGGIVLAFSLAAAALTSPAWLSILFHLH
jgi:hypothetical protein